MLNEKALEIILNFKEDRNSKKLDKTLQAELLKLKDDIKKIITLLPKEEQDILDLRFFQNLSVDEIAKKIDKPRDEVSKNLLEGINSIKENLKTSVSTMNKSQSVKDIAKTITVKNKNIVFPPKPKVLRRSSFTASLFSLLFWLIIFCSFYFLTQKYFLLKLPTINQIYGNVSNVVSSLKINEKSDKVKPSKGYIKISGSSSLLPLSQRWKNSFSTEYPQYNVKLVASDSDQGIKNLIDSKVDIANSSRPISFLEKKKAAEKGLELIEERVALDALIIIVNKKNSLNEISLDGLEGIFSNKIKNWQELVSYNKPVIVVIREEGSGTNEFVKDRILQGTKFPSLFLRLKSNQEIIKFVSENEAAISFVNSTNYPWENNNIKFLKVNNYDNSLSVSPFDNKKLDEQAIRYGDYPLAHYLYLVVQTNASRKVKDFTEWVLEPKGQEVVEHSGLLPVVTED